MFQVGVGVLHVCTWPTFVSSRQNLSEIYPAQRKDCGDCNLAWQKANVSHQFGLPIYYSMHTLYWQYEFHIDLVSLKAKYQKVNLNA